MASYASLAADELVSLLAAEVWANAPSETSVEKDYAPDHDLRSDGGVLISVGPSKQKLHLDQGARCGDDYSIGLEVAIRYKLPGKTKPEWTPQVHDMLGFVTDVQQFIRNEAISLDIGDFILRLVDIEDDPLYDPDSLRTRRLFVSYLSLHYALES